MAIVLREALHIVTKNCKMMSADTDSSYFITWNLLNIYIYIYKKNIFMSD